MDVHASPATLPELEAFLSMFNLHFRRSEGKAALERYLTGLLTESPNKTVTRWPPPSQGPANNACKTRRGVCQSSQLPQSGPRPAVAPLE